MDRDRKPASSAWPIYVALLVVVALAAANVVVDLVVDAKIQTLTTGIVDNALRSLALVDDLRGQAAKLAGPAAPGELAEIRAHIDSDARSYEPIATYIGERAEWQHLQGLLDQLQRADGDRTALLRAVNESIDHLAAINQREAADHMEAIGRTQKHSFGLDIVSGLIVFGVAVLVMAIVSRLVRSHRRLVAEQFEANAERQRDLEAFAGRVAHDLRHPLTPLRLAAGMLAANPTATPKVIDRITRNVDQMAAIIDNLLALSTSGQPEPGKADLAPVIAEVVDQSESVLHGAEVTVSVQNCTVACSAAVVRQIVANLLTNASKYRSPDRALRVTITGVAQAGFAELTVADNGIGMDEATAAHVFEPLYRAEAARAIPGHGLGLAIVGRTVRALDGTYSVKSTRGTGSQFTIRLPLAPVEHPGPTLAEA